MLGSAFGMILTIPLTIFAFLSVPLYPLAQLGVVFLRRGPGMWLALLPIGPMMAAYVAFHQAWQDGGNLSPLILIFTSPVALIWILVVGHFARRRDLAALIDRWLSRGRD
jgi:hypothetical protein